ncbi:Uncharacterized protein Fot_25610 [Forsythia ovata]|uniref:LAGLIDADG homing endonuclease n=1 Tax=Forsythia ovata TaxID=205694 RepID=A0ABD1U9N6_9LAMI
MQELKGHQQVSREVRIIQGATLSHVSAYLPLLKNTHPTTIAKHDFNNMVNKFNINSNLVNNIHLLFKLDIRSKDPVRLVLMFLEGLGYGAKAICHTTENKRLPYIG